jgi:hypothetical protein
MSAAAMRRPKTAPAIVAFEQMVRRLEEIAARRPWWRRLVAVKYNAKHM